MTKVILKNSAGQFLVEGSGFSGNQANATRYDEAAAACTTKCAAKLGVLVTPVIVKELSYAVVYIRKGEGVRLLKGLGKNPADANFGQIDPSKRRFATRDEAIVHGSRFAVRKANKFDKPGTAGHEGFFVVETNDPVNASVNPATGLTNKL